MVGGMADCCEGGSCRMNVFVDLGGDCHETLHL